MHAHFHYKLPDYQLPIFLIRVYSRSFAAKRFCSFRVTPLNCLRIISAARFTIRSAAASTLTPRPPQRRRRTRRLRCRLRAHVGVKCGRRTIEGAESSNGSPRSRNSRRRGTGHRTSNLVLPAAHARLARWPNSVATKTDLWKLDLPSCHQDFPSNASV